MLYLCSIDIFDWWIGPRVFVSSPFLSCFGELGKRGESCPETRFVRGVGDGLEAGRLVDGIGPCVGVSMFLVSCVLHFSLRKVVCFLRI